MKKKILVCAVLVICLSVAAYGTTAYLTYVETATNVITAGNIRIALNEWSHPEGGDRVPFEDVFDVMPGEAVSKIVEIENVGSSDAWIRIKLDKSLNLAEGVTGEVDLDLISYDIDTENWTEKDGYYYYNHILAPGETTAPLFTQVLFSKDMSNLYQNSQALIKVTAQATQVSHNGQTVLEAAGWPSEA